MGHVTYHIDSDTTKCSCGWIPEEGADTLEAAAEHVKNCEG